MKIFNASMIALATLGCAVRVFSQAGGSGERMMTLRELVDSALSRNQAILAEVKKVESLEQVPSQASSLPDPQLSVEWMNIRASKPDLSDALNDGVTIGVTREFPFPGKRGLRKEEADLMVKGEKESLRGLRARVASDVKAAYYSLMYYDSVLKILELSREALKNGVETAMSMYSAGAGISADILKGQASLTEIENKKLELEKMRSMTMDQMDLLLGLPPATNIPIYFAKEELPDLPALEAILEEAALSPMVREAESAREAEEKKVQMAKKEFKPDIMLGGYYRMNDMTMEGKDYFTVMAGITLPVFNRRTKYKPALEEAVLNRESAGYAAEYSLVQAKYDLSESYRTARQSRESYDLITQALLPQAQALLQSVTASYSVGKADFEYFVDSLMAVYDYQAEAEGMKAELFKAFARMEGITGKLPAGTGEPEKRIEP